MPADPPDHSAEPEPTEAKTALPADPATRDLVASLLPEYSVVRILGAGGMGTVYLAREPSLRRLVAVKIISSQLAALHPLRLRFEREARAAALVSHPNVVQVYRVGTTSELSLPFIVMEYVEGRSLKDRIDTTVPVRESEARRILGSLASALAGAHKHGLVHRDVKPANVLIQEGTDRLFLTDFGVAGALEPETLGEETTLTDSGLRLGTPSYMSPEQAAGGKTGPESDVYSLGVLAFELLTGKPPFSAPSAALLAAAHVMTPPPSLAEQRPDLQPDLVRLVDACLAKDPADRPTAAQVAAALVPSLHDLPDWPPADLKPLLGQGATLARWAAIVGVAAILVAIGLAHPPQVVQAAGEWWSRFENEARIATSSSAGVRRIAASGTQGILVWVWGAVLILGSIAVSFGMLALLWRGAALLPAIRRARRDRPATLVPDLLADSDGTSGSLRQEQETGHGKEGARRVLVLRRRKSGFLLLGGASLGVLLMAVCLAVAAGLVDTSRTGSLLGPTILVILAVPAAALFVGFGAGVRESRSRAALRPAGQGRSRPSRVRSPTRGTSLSWIAAACGVAGVAALTASSVSAMLAARSVLRFGPPTAELADTIQSLGTRDPIRRAGAEWRQRMGTPLRPEPPKPGRANREPSPVAPDRLVEALGANPRGEPAVLAALRRTRASLSVDTLRLLDRFAGIAPAEPDRLADPQAITRAMHTNILAALQARTRNDWRGAISALGRNAASAESLWSSTDPFLVQFGAGTFESFALAPAALVAELAGDSGDARALRAIGASVRGLTLPVWETRMLGFAGDPSDFGALRRAAVFSGIPLAYRRAGLEGIRDGFCLNPGEILGGPARERVRAVAEVAREIGSPPDDPHVAAITRGLEGLSGHTPGRVVARIRHCAAVGR